MERMSTWGAMSGRIEYGTMDDFDDGMPMDDASNDSGDWRRYLNDDDSSITDDVETMIVELTDGSLQSKYSGGDSDNLSKLKQLVENAIFVEEGYGTKRGWCHIKCHIKRMTFAFILMSKLRESQRRGWCRIKRMTFAFILNSKLRRFLRRARVRSGIRGARPSKMLGVRKRQGKWASEIRISVVKQKVWLGSFETEIEAALAFDAGKYHSCSRYNKFNFPDSPRLLGPRRNLHLVNSEERKEQLKIVARDFATTHSHTVADHNS